MSDLSETENIPILIDVSTKPITTVVVGLQYSDETKNYNMEVEPSTKYTVVYLDNKQLKKVTGIVRDITKIYKLNETDTDIATIEDYMITLDASTEFVSNVVKFKTNQIRSIKRFVKYADEGTDLTEASSHGGTTIGAVTKIVIQDATIDDKGHTSGGTTTGGDTTGETTGGITDGKNKNGNHVYITDGKVTGGTISGGTMVSGDMVSGTYTITGGTTVDSTGVTYHATITGNATNVIIANSVISGGTSAGGTVFDPTLTDTVVIGGTVTSGGDMKTIGGITEGDITYGGTIYGGTVTGGEATGIINGKTGYATGDIVTTGGTTTGGVTTGGTVIGGTSVGSIIINATVIGGTATGGTTTGGTTTGGTITYKDIQVTSGGGATKVVDPGKAQEETTKAIPDGLIVSVNAADGVRSNIADETANITPTITSVSNS